MNAKKLGGAAAALLIVASLAACGSDDPPEDSSIAFAPLTGDDFGSNPGAWQTDGVPVPVKGVTMVGDPVAAQAVANSGLQQGTITATSGDATVYYPKAPDVPGLPVAPQDVAPPPPQFTRPVNTVPWNYTPHQIAVYRQICETGHWNDWAAGVEVQSQTCWTVYGRQLGVRPWYPGQPKPWESPSWPTPWFEPGFRADVPVMWVYPPDWSQPRPQPLISVSIGVDVPQNPHARPNPRYRDRPFYPVWAVTPGRPVAVHDQARVVAPWLPAYASATSEYAAAPVYPGVVLEPMPTSGRAEVVTAVPGAQVVGNPYRDSTVLAPTAAAIAGATVYNGTRAQLARALGTDVDVRVATSGRTSARTSDATTSRTAKKTTTTTTAKKATTTSGKAADKTSDAAGTTTTKPTTSKPDTTAPSGSRTTPKTTTTKKTTEKPATTTKTTTAKKTTTKASTTTSKRVVTTTTTTKPAQ